RLAGAEAEVLERVDGELGDVDLEELKAIERAVPERVLGVARALQILLAEGFGVDDQDAATLEVAEVGAQRRGVHRHQHVDVVARGEDFLTREVELERADAGERAGRSANLGREVGQRADVVAGESRLGGELHAGELHAVARVAREANDYRLSFFDLFRRLRLSRRRGYGHRVLLSQYPVGYIARSAEFQSIQDFTPVQGRPKEKGTFRISS